MDSEAKTLNLLERMLLDDTAGPTDLPISLLKMITKDFSEDLIIGRGGFAVVYKGCLGIGGTAVAVKKLHDTIDMDGTKYNKEVNCLMRVRHENIVRFLGYCANTHEKMVDYNGKFVMADVRHRLLCFEYLHKGSLHNYLKDAYCGLEWRTCYQIIKGICKGLQYLHEQDIIHLDLKPANILLDHNMVPKISDFGLSRFFDKEQSQAIITSELFGSTGYVAPEFYSGVISFKSDIYSLGVIIMELMTGQKGYSSVDDVLENWRNRLEVSSTSELSEQVRVCAKISIDCMGLVPKDRPAIQSIIHALDETERTDQFTESSMSTSSVEQICCSHKWEFLSAHPLPLHFHWKHNHLMSSCLLHLTNNTEVSIAFRIQTKNHGKYLLRPLYGLVQPRSTYIHRITISKPLYDELFTIESTVADEQYQPDIDISKEHCYSHFFRKAKEGREVQQVKLSAIFVHETGNKIIQPEYATRVASIAVHPTETWIITSHDDSMFHMWNYRTQKGK